MYDVRMKRQLSHACSMYGADMGRPNRIPHDFSTAGKLHLVKLEWVDGDYDKGGAYWGGGSGDHVYWSYGETATEQIEVFVRAKSHDEAKEKVKYLINCKTLRFYR